MIDVNYRALNRSCYEKIDSARKSEDKDAEASAVNDLFELNLPIAKRMISTFRRMNPDVDRDVVESSYLNILWDCSRSWTPDKGEFTTYFGSAARKRFGSFFISKSKKKVDRPRVLYEPVAKNNDFSRTLNSDLIQPLREGFAVLQPLELDIIRMRYVEGLSYGQIRDVTGKTKEGVSKIEDRALAKLKAFVMSSIHSDECLKPAEKKVLEMRVQGCTHRDVGSNLKLSVEVVRDLEINALETLAKNDGFKGRIHN